MESTAVTPGGAAPSGDPGRRWNNAAQPLVKRPLRLWFATILNALSGIEVLVSVVFVAASGVGESLELEWSDLLLAGGVSLALLATSIIALVCAPRGSLIMLVAALLFYGLRIANGLALLLEADADVDARLIARIIRSALLSCLTIAAFMYGAKYARSIGTQAAR